MIEIWEIVSSFLKYLAPLAIVVFGILATWGVIKWISKVGEAIHGLSQKPGFWILAILVVGLLLYFWFMFLDPLL